MHDQGRIPEIIKEIKQLADEALRLVNYEGRRSWYANLLCALDHEHEYMDQSTTLSDVVEEGLSQTVRKVSNKFSELLKNELGSERLNKVIERNKRDDQSFCHSHDFFDTNTIMAKAMTLCGQDNADVDLWNTAWELAKDNEFNQI